MFDSELIERLLNLKTPFYYYNTDLLLKTLESINKNAEQYNYHIHYAIKANANKKILRIISNYGLGADCVSGHEIQRALKCSFKASKIVFAGVGKTDDEINYALSQNIFCINCESMQEIEITNKLALEYGKKQRVALRINPDINANTHKNISTGTKSTKFGISSNELEFIILNKDVFSNLMIEGIHFHIGSQITDLNAFEHLCTKVNAINMRLLESGFKIKHVNFGGGLGINYENPENQIPDFRKYFAVFNENFKPIKMQTIHFEPGRAIVGQCGILLTRVLFVKTNENIKTIILDAGLTELLRPALYQANHKIVNLTSDGIETLYDVAGPICETTDYFGRSVRLPDTNRGDLIAIFSVGAYGEVMASGYNLRSLAMKYFSDEIVTKENTMV
jgi:diaminopimelate decarboxylase